MGKVKTKHFKIFDIMKKQTYTAKKFAAAVRGNFKFSDENGRKEYDTAEGGKVFATELAQDAIVYDGGGNILSNFEFTVDNKVYITDENGRIVSITDKTVSSENIEFSDEQLEVVKEVVADIQEEAQDKLDEIIKRVADLEAENATLKAENEALKAKADTLGTENINLRADRRKVNTQFSEQPKDTTKSPLGRALAFAMGK